MERIKILIADDHKLVREGIRQFLRAQTRYNADVYEAEDGNQAVALYTALGDIDLVMMDVKMPDKNGIEATREIVTRDKYARILSLSMHDEDSIVKEMIRAGAKGYILKNASPEEMLEAITRVLASDRYFSSDVAMNLMEPYLDMIIEDMPFIRRDAEILTKREKEILRMITLEKSSDEMAEELGLSKRTVEKHRYNILNKLGVKNSVGLMKYAIKIGLVK